jgi:tetratricopeptide (TPR) repeat protein
MRGILVRASVPLLVALSSAGPVFAGEAPAARSRAPGASAASASSAASEKQRAVFAGADFDEAHPERAVEALRAAMRTRDLTFAEAFDFGTAWFLQQRWERAVVAYETAAREASKPDERALAYLAAAQSAAMGKRFTEAGRLANAAHRLDPKNGAIAAYRVAFWSSADDRLELRAAEDAAKRLNVRMEGREVCEPGIVIAIACFAAATVISLYAIHEGALTPDDIMKILRDLMITIPSALVMKKLMPKGGLLSGP